MTTAIGVMARAPSASGKTRLAPHFSTASLRALRSALLADTLGVLAGVPDVFIFFTPDEAQHEIAQAGGAATTLVPQGTGDLGARMLAAIRHLLEAREYRAAVLIGSDVPFLTANHVADALNVLHPSAEGSAVATSERTTGRRLVLGPANDGGYYLIGMTQVFPELFEEIAWGTESVLTDTLRTAERIGVDARLIGSAYDIDTIDDVKRLEHDLEQAPADACVNLRRWFNDNQR